MESKFALKQGELLKLLADRSKLSKVEIAEQLRINPTTLSKIFKYPKLSPKIRAEGARLFKVPIEYFEGVGVQDVTLPIFEEPPPPEYRTGSTWQDIAEQEGKMRAEIARLKEENRQLLLRIAEKDGYIADKQATIEDLLAVLRNKKKDE